MHEEYKGIELGLWHNGSPVSPLYINSMYVRPGAEFYPTLPSNRGGWESFKIRGVFGDELMPDWMSLRVMLIDHNNVPIGTERPGLLYNGPSDCYTTVAFPSLVARPLEHAGMWVLTMRVADTYDTLRRRAEAAAAPAPLVDLEALRTYAERQEAEQRADEL